MKTNFYLCYKLKNKTLFEELQDYKVKAVLETERLQDSIRLKGRVTRLQERKEYKGLSKREGEGGLLSGVRTREFGP